MQLKVKNGIQTWRLNVQGAPVCEHGNPAALVTGTSASGKAWKAWKCALGSGDQWRDKCEFNEWVRGR